jgi:hypothetical protein
MYSLRQYISHIFTMTHAILYSLRLALRMARLSFICMSLSFEVFCVAQKLAIQHEFKTYTTGKCSVLCIIVIYHISPNIRRPPIIQSENQKRNARSWFSFEGFKQKEVKTVLFRNNKLKI